ncbi:MAG: LamG-like jellyroll fold domain-containing protein, partial [Verrucomicrobiota bacterium]
MSNFAGNVGVSGDKPVMTRVGPHDGNLYYLLTDYETNQGKVQLVRYTGLPTVKTPIITPPGGQHDDPLFVTLTTATAGADIRFTLDGSLPTESSMLYTGPVWVATSLTFRARGYLNPTLQPSSVQSADFIIGPVPNLVPVAVAGPDQVARTGSLVRINGAASFDPDGNELELGEHWSQVAGPPITLGNADEAEAFFTPTATGQYIFELTVTDLQGAADTDIMAVTVVNDIGDVRLGLVGQWSFEEGAGTNAFDRSPNANTLHLEGPGWSTDTADGSGSSAEFDGVDDLGDLDTFDVGSTGLTLALWFYADDFDTHDARFISKASGSADADHVYMLSALNETDLRFRLRTGGVTTTLIAPDVLNVGEWMHVAGVYDGSMMRLYVNGADVAAVAKTGMVDTDPSMDVAVGNQPAAASGGARPFDGRIDELRIYDRGLNATEVDTLHNLRSIPPRGLWLAGHGLPIDADLSAGLIDE